jgi:hypothetical protein
LARLFLVYKAQKLSDIEFSKLAACALTIKISEEKATGGLPVRTVR